MLLGIDLSMAAPAAVAAPVTWRGDWSVVRTCKPRHPKDGESDGARVRRFERIARDLVTFARECEAQRAFIEGYAFGKGHRAHHLGELGGIVRLELVRAGVEVVSVPPATARKVLLGKVPRSGAKVAVCEALRAAGAPQEWTLDELDAMCVLNWAMAEHCGQAFVG